MKTVAGLFETPEQAARAVADLREAGIRPEDIGVVLRHDRAPDAEEREDEHSQATGVAAIGGGVLGALGGLLVGTTVLVVPGIGPALAAGTIASAVIGGALGAGAGGILGALIDAGLTEEEARHYQAGVERGGVLMTVLIPDKCEADLREVFRANGLRDLDYHRNLWDENPSHRYDLARTPTLDAHPGAQMRAAEHQGAVWAGGATGAVLGGVVGGLTGGVVGATLGTAMGTLAGGAAGAALDYKQAERYFREHWERSLHREHLDWEQASAAYRYGWERAGAPELHGRPWQDVRSDLERGWPGTDAWPDAEPLVRTAWDRRTNPLA